jgi:hypothetical protein
MIKEAIDRLVQLAAVSMQPTLLQLDERTKILACGGKTERIAMEPNRAHRLEVLSDLIAAAKYENVEGDGAPVIFYSLSAVVLLPDRTNYRDRYVMLLRQSPEYAMLRALSEELTWFDQRGFIRLLAHELQVDKTRIMCWRKLDWRSGVVTVGEVAHGKDRLGREIAAQVTATSDLPEEIVLSIPIFDNSHLRNEHTIICDVEIDAQQQKLALMPRRSDLNAAVNCQLAMIGAELRAGIETSMPIYQGVPFAMCDLSNEE